MEKILWRRSSHLRDQQQAWQVQFSRKQPVCFFPQSISFRWITFKLHYRFDYGLWTVQCNTFINFVDHSCNIFFLLKMLVFHLRNIVPLLGSLHWAYSIIEKASDFEVHLMHVTAFIKLGNTRAIWQSFDLLVENSYNLTCWRNFIWIIGLRTLNNYLILWHVNFMYEIKLKLADFSFSSNLGWMGGIFESCMQKHLYLFDRKAFLWTHLYILIKNVLQYYYLKCSLLLLSWLSKPFADCSVEHG